MSVDLALSLALFAAFMVYAARRLLVLLHVFQQEGYDNDLFPDTAIRQIAERSPLNGVRVSEVAYIAFIVSLAFPVVWYAWFPDLREIIALFWGLTLLALAAWEPWPFRGKKPLSMTPRAWRIYLVSLALCIGVLLFVVCLAQPWIWPFLWLTMLVVWPAVLVAANFLLSPYEANIQRRYWREAHEKLTRLKPVVIGITGSFGKTSVKHILTHILNTAAPTLATPGSVNTPMGITRIIREQLEPRHRYFIAEMGAYGIGSIKRLCDLAPPTHAIVTAVGPAHLERFGSIENTAIAKSELPSAATGMVVMPRALLAHPPFACVHELNPGRFVFPEYYDTVQTVNGLEVTIDGRTLRAPLYGAHHGDNIALTYTLARALGLDADLIAAALRTVPQIRHRLEVGAYPTGATLIDDAYNANPDGVRAGLDLLDFLAQGQKRRILVTPGVVELGAEHAAVHRDLGAYAAQKADVIFAVAARRIPTFVEGVRAAGGQDVREVARFADAQAWLMAETGPGDVILIANDLPDIYEG